MLISDSALLYPTFSLGLSGTVLEEVRPLASELRQWIITKLLTCFLEQLDGKAAALLGIHVVHISLHQAGYVGSLL